MSEVQDNQRSIIDQLLDSAESIADNKVTYVTQTRLHIGSNEATLDLYYTAPALDGSLGELVSHHTHRIILPLGLAKELARSLQEGTSTWEEKTGISLPFVPQGMEVDEDET